MAIEEASAKGSVLAHEPSRRTVIAVFVALMVCEVIGSLDQTIVSTGPSNHCGRPGRRQPYAVGYRSLCANVHNHYAGIWQDG